MRRLFIIGASAVLLGSMVPIALADDTPTTDEEVPAERVLSEAQMRKAQLIADYFAPDEGSEGDVTAEEDTVTVERIIELRTGVPAVGWGALYKLLLLEAAGIDVDRDEGGWGFGIHFKELRDNGDWPSEDTPKNLGQLMKQQRLPRAAAS